jgi:hypothetical protein
VAFSQPTQQTLRELASWTPPHGVLSLYLDIDPADRGEGWRIALRNGLDRAVDEARRHHERATRIALEATVARVVDRFPSEAPHPGGRSQIGFLEVADDDDGDERWFSLQLPCRTEVVHDRNPYLVPLVAILDEGGTGAIALVSSERVRLLRWALGRAEDLEDWELETLELAWRERKSQRSADPARVQGAKASGRDQYDERLAANRERFLHETGRLAAERATALGLGELLVVGEAEYAPPFIEGAAGRLQADLLGSINLISAPEDEAASRLTELLRQRKRDRQRDLVARVLGEGHGGTRGALGARETLEALTQGRVEHLVFDAGRDWDAVDAGDGDRVPLRERLVELALQTGAEVTPVEGESAEALAAADGVAALLRY